MDSVDPAVAAVYVEALEDLHERRLASLESETSYSLTGTGFKLARSLKSSLAKAKKIE
jgi:hypothetical protein